MSGEAVRTDLLPLFGNPRIHRRYQDDYFGPLIDSLFADRTPAAVGWVHFTGAGVDTELIVLGTQTYEFDTAVLPGVITAGNIRVGLSAPEGGAAAPATCTALAAAVNADPDRVVDAVVLNVGDAVGFVARVDVGDDSALIPFTTPVLTNGAISGGGTLDHADTPQEYTGARGMCALSIGSDVALDAGESIVIGSVVSDTEPDWLQVQARSAAGLHIAMPATATLQWSQAGSRWLLELSDSSGGTTLVDTTEIHWQASVR